MDLLGDLREELKGIEYQKKIVETKIRAIQEFCSHKEQRHDNDPRGSSSQCLNCEKWL